MSHLDNGFRSLTLQRFPATDDVNPLQAWERSEERRVGKECRR